MFLFLFVCLFVCLLSICLPVRPRWTMRHFGCLRLFPLYCLNDPWLVSDQWSIYRSVAPYIIYPSYLLLIASQPGIKCSCWNKVAAEVTHLCRRTWNIIGCLFSRCDIDPYDQRFIFSNFTKFHEDRGSLVVVVVTKKGHPATSQHKNHRAKTGKTWRKLKMTALKIWFCWKNGFWFSGFEASISRRKSFVCTPWN